jgi:hypothetical protein
MTQANNVTVTPNDAVIAFDGAAVADAVVSIVAGLDAKAVLIAGFKGLGFDAFAGRQKIVIKALVDSGCSKNEEAAAKMLQRALTDCNIEKPKSESAEAVKKAEARKAEKTAEAKKLASVVTAAKKEAGKGADELAVRKIIAEKAATGDTLATKALAQINEAAREMAKVKNAEMVKAIKAELANASTDTLQQIAILLKIKS